MTQVSIIPASNESRYIIPVFFVAMFLISAVSLMQAQSSGAADLPLSPYAVTPV